MLGRKVGLGLAARGDVSDAVAYAREAQRAGFDSIWLHESYFERDGVTYLTAIAAATETIHVGAGALNPYTRHPVVLAMTASTLDNLAPGRFALALGSGLPLRLNQMNLPYDDTVAKVSETIDQVRTLWRGERVRFGDKGPPVQPMFPPTYCIPVYVAGYQARFVALCGEKADGYLARPAESVPAIQSIRRRVAEAARAAGRAPEDLQFAGYLLSLVDDSRRDALNRAKREPFVIYMMSVLSDVSLKRAGFPRELRDQIAAAWRAEDYHAAAQLIPDDLLDAFLLCGTVEDVARRALAYRDAGLDVPLLQPVLQEDEQVGALLEAGAVFAGLPESRVFAVPSAQVEAATATPSGAGEDVPSLAGHVRRKVAAYWEIARPFSFTASVVPVAVGGALAARDGHFSVAPFVLAALGGVGLQLGTNVVNEIYDVRKGTDNITSPRASHALLKGVLSEDEAFRFGFAGFGLAVLVGVLLIAYRGWPMMVLGLLGLLGGYFYTAPPFEYKYRALGVPLVFFLMGPLMVEGSYLATAGQFSLQALVASVPVGLLVAAILHANEWRDIAEDARLGSRTLSSQLGAGSAHLLYLGLLVGAYLSVAAAAMVHLLPTFALLTIMSLPIFVSVLRASELGSAGHTRAIAMIDLKTARLHLWFGALLTLGLLLAAVLQS